MVIEDIHNPKGGHDSQIKANLNYTQILLQYR